MDDRAKGKAKEAWGALTGDEAKKEEGRAEQRKGEAQEAATQKARTNQAKKEAREAEREQSRQNVKDKGLLGSVTDPLTGPDRDRRS
jgi:uncharacterized protein YjbJ (UPF0337 family)